MFGVGSTYVVVTAKFWLLSCSNRLSLAGRSFCAAEGIHSETYRKTLLLRSGGYQYAPAAAKAEFSVGLRFNLRFLRVK